MKNIIIISLIAVFVFSRCERKDRSWNLPRTNVLDSVAINKKLASLTTSEIVSITQTSAQTGGNITNEGDSAVISRGICYSTKTNPTLTNNTIISGSGKGSFTANLSALTANTKYYVRAFASNAFGTAYGNELSFNLLPSGSCNITTSTNSTSYVMQTPSQSIFKQKDSYTITMYNSTSSFGQASSVDLFDNDVLVYNFGTFIYFSSNSRTFTLPTGISSSNCYNIRVSQGSSIYVSPPFTIIP